MAGAKEYICPNAERTDKSLKKIEDEDIFYASQNIIRVINSRWTAWAEHVASMGEMITG
jgi:hypothetical protein